MAVQHHRTGMQVMSMLTCCLFNVTWREDHPLLHPAGREMKREQRKEEGRGGAGESRDDGRTGRTIDMTVTNLRLKIKIRKVKNCAGKENNEEK